MATQLDKAVEREVKVHGIEEPVLIEISPEGMTARLKGTRIALSQGWVQIIEAMNTPTNVPSFLMGRPYHFLQHSAQKRAKKVLLKKTS